MIKALAVFLILFSLFFGSIIVFTTPVAPEINGVIIDEAKSLGNFKLLSHSGGKFSRVDLKGRWHLIIAGYTSCPDVCPTTLSILAEVERRLNKRQQYHNLGIIFYSVDYKRDKLEKLSGYISYFSENFIALTRDRLQPVGHIAFEEGLGISSVIDPAEVDTKGGRIDEEGNYTVSHTVNLLLLNPEAELQAVFKPLMSGNGREYFSADQLFQDYVKVRAHLAN